VESESRREVEKDLIVLDDGPSCDWRYCLSSRFAPEEADTVLQFGSGQMS